MKGREHFAEYGVEIGETADTTHAYLVSIHWALDFLLWCEIDLIHSQTDQVIGALARLVGFVGTSIFLARIAFLVQQYVDSNLNNLQDVCNHFLETHSISTDLSVRMKKFVISCYQQSWLESKLEEDSCPAVECMSGTSCRVIATSCCRMAASTRWKELRLFSKMPKSLQTDLYEESRGPFLAKSSFMQEFQDVTSLSLCIRKPGSACLLAGPLSTLLPSHLHGGADRGKVVLSAWRLARTPSAVDAHAPGIPPSCTRWSTNLSVSMSDRQTLSSLCFFLPSSLSLSLALSLSPSLSPSLSLSLVLSLAL